MCSKLFFRANKINALFINSPELFLQKYAVNAFAMFDECERNPQKSDNIFNFQLIHHNKLLNEVFLKIDPKNKKNGIKAYLLPYVSDVMSKEDVGSIRIPKKEPLANFVFTPTLTGCSIIVEEHANHYVLYHDPRSVTDDADVVISPEYHNVISVLTPDQMEYKDSAGHKVLGFALLAYDKHKGWQLILQCAEFDELDRDKGIQHFKISARSPNPSITPLQKPVLCADMKPGNDTPGAPSERSLRP